MRRCTGSAMPRCSSRMIAERQLVQRRIVLAVGYE
jgi:hypothetical protein